VQFRGAVLGCSFGGTVSVGCFGCYFGRLFRYAVSVGVEVCVLWWYPVGGFGKEQGVKVEYAREGSVLL